MASILHCPRQGEQTCDFHYMRDTTFSKNCIHLRQQNRSLPAHFDKAANQNKGINSEGNIQLSIHTSKHFRTSVEWHSGARLPLSTSKGIIEAILRHYMYLSKTLPDSTSHDLQIFKYIFQRF